MNDQQEADLADIKKLKYKNDFYLWSQMFYKVCMGGTFIAQMRTHTKTDVKHVYVVSW